MRPYSLIRSGKTWEVIGDEQKKKAYTDKHIHGIKTDDELAMEQLQAIWAAEEAFRKEWDSFIKVVFNRLIRVFKKRESDPNQPELGLFGFHNIYGESYETPDLAQEGMDLIRKAIEINQGQDKKLDSLWVLYGRAYREKGEHRKGKTLGKAAK